MTASLDEDLAAGTYGSTLLLKGVEELKIGYFGSHRGNGNQSRAPSG